MIGDQLSEAFDLVEVRGVLTGGFAVRGRWFSRAPVGVPLKFVAMVSGRARLSTAGANGADGPIDLEPGDVVLLNDRTWLELRGGTGDGPPREIVPEEDDPTARLDRADRGLDDIVIGGRIDLNPAGRALLLQALPPVGHVRGSDATATNLRGTLDRLFKEVSRGRIGSGFAVRQYGQLLMLEVVRAYVEQAELPPGWLRVLTDDRLRPALTAMHAEPGRPWGLDELARTAAMSRTSFAERFREMAGMPPLTYLNHWRMTLAQRALRHDDVRVGELALRLGFSSESAFSTAFKRHVGEPPRHYRHRARAEPEVDGQRVPS